MRFIYFLIGSCLIVFTGCNNQGSPSAKNNADSIKKVPTPKEPVSSKLDHEGTTLLMSVMSKYYNLKNALVATKAARADSAALQLVVMAGILQRYLTADTSRGKALTPYVDTILLQGRAIPSLHDESCERQRIAFGHISGAIYGLVKNAGLKNAGIFHEYCPMAFNEKGASWLSDESEIKNPYFGRKMLECGEVTDSLP